jgi:ketosteroid isomerase-like protein
MSQENVEIVKQAVGAINQRDIDGYLACCTDDVQLTMPAAEVMEYDGPDGIRRYFADIADTAPDFKITTERLEPVGKDRVLAFTRASGTGRASGVPLEMLTGNVYDLANGKIRRIRIFFDRQLALEAAGLSE